MFDKKTLYKSMMCISGKRMLKLLFTMQVVFFLSQSTLHSQEMNIDSLKQIVNGKVHDTVKLKALSFLLYNYPSTSKEYGYFNEKFKKIAIFTINNKQYNALVKEKAYDALAAYNMNKAYQSMQSDYLLTIKYLHKSLEYYNPKYFVTDKYLLGGRGYVLISLGVMYNKIGNTTQSINNYFEALKIFEKYNHKSSISYALQSIANLHFDQKKYDEALDYYTRAYETFYKNDKLDYQDNIQKVLLFISIAKCHQELLDCELAENYLNKGLTLALKLDDKDILAELHFNFGKNEEKCKQNNEKALLEYQKSLTNSKLPENNANSHIAIGSVQLKQKKYAEAEQNLTNGLNFAQKINHLEFQKQALENLYILYKKGKKFEKALEINELYYKIKDSIKEESNYNELTKRQLEYEYETKQAKLELEQERKLNQIELETQQKNAVKNNLLIGLSGVLLLLLVGSYLLYRNYKQKQAISVFEKSALNQKLLLSQMNPHFIFNSIDNIQSLIYNKQEKEAVSYLGKFSKLTRQILENSNENYITLNEELIMIDNYLTIQQLLYNNKFDFIVEVDPSIQPEAILLPPMLTQPFIENAIKHGLKNKTEKGFLSIHFKLQNNKLLFEVADNGEGFNPLEMESKNKSLAIKITKERLKHISKKSEFEIQMENRLDAEKNTIGAKVFFEIPYLYEN